MFFHQGIFFAQMEIRKTAGPDRSNNDNSLCTGRAQKLASFAIAKPCKVGKH
jgi:hypothetical protein